MGVILANVILAITFAFLLVAGMLGIALLAVIATLFFHLNLGLPNDGNKQYETSERQGFDMLSDAYGAGFHSTLVVIAEPDE
ncbi:hypothetical protein [Paenibacillus sp. FSL R7-0331]|uniref:hypothetical protein n=1 Tax=Paenibacillus sp. FSL R7-0331 TaxID=1536773 RepID=UPI0004F8E3BA|nr:hypothetical protein [Paenibacillus sp. FSL R7-0331]AIQ51320.1 hypothetical protein R70331_07220 [Paenibacillus sp. FSL R7-0331]